MLDHSKLGQVTPVGPRGLVLRLVSAPAKPRFSICTMVTNWRQYADCLASFRNRGFDAASCEFLVLDNTEGNRADAFVAANEFLQAANGDYVVLTHQDVTLIDHGYAELEARLEELTAVDPFWGLCGNAGHTRHDKPVLYLSHPVRDNHVEGGPFPAAVVSLDENFIVVRRLANLALSRDLVGFHHYGADLCTIADILGWRAYVIFFHLRHHSGGTLDESYHRSGKAISRKYTRALRPRWVHLLSERSFFIPGNGLAARRARFLRRLRKFVSRLRQIAGSLRQNIIGRRLG